LKKVFFFFLFKNKIRNRKTGASGRLEAKELEEIKLMGKNVYYVTKETQGKKLKINDKV